MLSPAVVDLALSQEGVISTTQLREHRIVGERLRWLASRSELVRVCRSIYRLRSHEPTWRQRAFAGLLLAGPGAALSHRSAAFLHELEGVDVGPRLHLTVPINRNMTRKWFFTHRTREKLPVTIVNGLAVTSLARTLVDLAAEATEEELELALDHAQRRRRGVLGWIDWYLGQLNQPRRPGMSTLSKLLDLRRGGGTDSVLEVQAWRRLRAEGFGGFVRQHDVSDAQGHVLRLDFAWPVLKVALHVDGYAFHSGRQQLQRDADQRSRLELLGWRQQVVMHGTLKGDAWVTQLRRKLEQAAATLGACSSGPMPTNQLTLFAS